LCESFIEELKATLQVLCELRIVAPGDGAEAGALRFYNDYFPEPDLLAGASDWTSAKRLWGQLSELPQSERGAAIRGDRQYLDTDFCDWLVVRAKRVCSSDPERAVSIAGIALKVARERKEKLGDNRRLALALDATAWCYVILRDFAAADEVLRELEELSDKAEEAVEEKAAYLTTRGFFYSQVGRLKEGDSHLAKVLELRKKLGNRKEVVCSLVNLASAAMTGADSSRALELYREAESLLDVDADPPRLQLMVYSNLVLALCETGQPSKARDALQRTRELAKTVGGWYWRVYTTWLEGTMARVERRHEAAEEIFEKVRSEFLTRGHLVWYVEASLDLARAQLQRGRVRALSRLASELLEVVEDDGDERVRASVVCFAEAVRQQSLSGQLLSSLAVALSSAQLTRRFGD
jgi:tetratricopeptide (TPR) repeat protein